MINTEIMRQILTQYEAGFPGWWKKEQNKWKAVEHFQKNWKIDAENFGEMFKEATRKASDHRLLDISHFQPRTAIMKIANIDDNAAREMFRLLFDEDKKKALEERVKAFSVAVKVFEEKNSLNLKKDLNTNAVSTFLWLYRPNKYYLFRYEIATTVVNTLKADYHIAKGKVEGMIAGYHLYDEIRAAIKADDSVCKLIRDAVNSTPDCYEDKEFVTATNDIAYYISQPDINSTVKQTGLSSIKLYADKSDVHESDTAKVGTEKLSGYWWLIAAPGKWSFSSIKAGEEQNYTLYGENGNKRRIFRNFLQVKAGDPVICYEATPTKRIVALGQITRENNKTDILFKKTEDLVSPVGYAVLKKSSELQKMEFFKSKGRGSLFKLTKNEYGAVMDMIRDSNPLSANKTLHPYSKQDFLKEVFLDEKSYDDLNGLLLHNKNVILQGPPGVGKTFAAKRLAYSIMDKRDDSRIEFVQFHQNYSYEDFVMGYRPKENGFELKYGVFYRFCQKAANDPDHKYFFIIDEINRGNVSKIFGELLMLIEKDKRMKFKADENAEDYSATLAYTEERFSVPENVHIIGMMNTADRSLAIIDYALRRRFCFFDMSPAFDCAGFREKLDAAGNPKFKSLIERIKALNEEIEKDSSLGAGFRIGHSYFCFATTEDVTDEWLRSIVDYEIVPLLQEYWFDDREKSENWKKTLKNVLNPGEGSSSASTGTASGGNSEPTAEQ